jgi:uncharacterized protein DUF6324
LSIDSESDKAANLVIGPTSLGMVRIFVESEGIELPMDFEPDEALEIANELRAAAERAAAMGKPEPVRSPKTHPGPGRGAKRGAKRDGPNRSGGGRRG